ncbi:ADP,ATP carrier protein, mitochondrial [Morus notabilis]|uniref:ADP,ATP carrier protein, mitochondrial n=1 Tax=Morus notabilis TaxID=981085 RepID=UPI000CED4598|nr:ADP,ATP carrier protein, mitochondrial [Morus notabilis]
MANAKQHLSVHEKISMHNRNHGMNFSYANAAGLKIPLSLTTCQSSTGLPHFSPGACSARGAKGLALPDVGRGIFGVAAVMAMTAVAPFNRVKLLLQNQNEMLNSGRLSGLTALPELLGMKASFPSGEETLLMSLDTSSPRLSLEIVCSEPAAQSAVSVSSPFFAYSLDYANTRLATDIKASAKGTTCPSIGFVCAPDYAKNNDIKAGERQFNGLVDVYEKTLRSDGIAGLYRGFNTACVGKIVFDGLYFGMTNSLIKPVVLNSESPRDNFFAGVMVKYRVIFGAAMACYPFDTVRRRNMMTLGEAIMYKNSWDAFNQIIKNEGAKSLFKGFGAKILHTSAITVAFVGCRQFYFSSI